MLLSALPLLQELSELSDADADAAAAFDGA